ncbi:MAG: GGDEF domain-containing protein [Treponema sp.]|jgi:diguanylate cyclase (GGDEF)-like protein|nr:GGDEF domain-containing protein [Treponema sp.]
MMNQFDALDPAVAALKAEIHSYEKLFSSIIDIFNHTAIDAILDSAVLHISGQQCPSSIVFLWKSFQNREDISIRGYKNYEIVDTGLRIENILPFERFFQEHSSSIHYAELCALMDNHAAAQSLLPVNPEFVMPIISPLGLYGLILIGQREDGLPYDTNELVFLKRLMLFVSIAIQNNLNYDHSLRDGKTGLYNNTFFMARLNEEVSRIKRNDCISSVIVIDVDFFKLFNDNFGHVAGDKALEYIASTIKQGVRLEDVPSRFGGEEFTVLLPNTNTPATWHVAERLRFAIANLDIPWEVPLPKLTISLGIFTFDKDSDVTATEIVHRADMALYESKYLGRNRIVVWEPGLAFRHT